MRTAKPSKIYIGCAGWTLPRQSWPEFASEGTHLERYASRFDAVEINSSFYRPHQHKTYARWASSVPESFRFSVKIPKAITHVARLRNTQSALTKFLDEVSGLGDQLGCLLVQLPPSLVFDESIADTFFSLLRSFELAEKTAIACEPRHVTWFTAQAVHLMDGHCITRVVADPSVAQSTTVSGRPQSSTYFRLHGSPRMYYSAYSLDDIAELASRLTSVESPCAESWCIFDNTADGAAIDNALQATEAMQRLLMDSASTA